VQIAGPLDVDVVLVRVMAPIVPLAIEGSTYFTVDDVAARLTEAREHLATLAANLRGRGIRATTDARHGEPVRKIVAAAREHGADMIAMTAHGRSGGSRFLFGSVAEAVLRELSAPRPTSVSLATVYGRQDDDAVRPGRVVLRTARHR
jgi:nucleotide-binding universal stress UspA family protein